MTRMQLISHPATPLPQVNSLGVALSPSGDGRLAAVFDCHGYADEQARRAERSDFLLYP